MFLILNDFILYLKSRGLAQVTIDRHEKKLLFFFSWLKKRKISKPAKISIREINAYQNYLHSCKDKAGNFLTLDHRFRHLASVKKFFAYMQKKNLIFMDPTIDLDLPKLPQALPRDILTDEETAMLFDAVDTGSPRGLRDRTILELFYATGIRNGELLNLRMTDINTENRTLKITGSKGLKDRVIPVSKRALDWVQKYRQEARPQLILNSQHKHHTLFVTIQGRKISVPNLSRTVLEYFRKAGLRKKGGIRVFRHSLATKMLEGGADTRYIQEMLGHSSLQSTQIYTRVSIQKLKEMHAKTHPRP